MKCSLSIQPDYIKNEFFDFLINHNCPLVIKDEKQFQYYDYLIYVPKASDNDFNDVKNYTTLDYKLVACLTNSLRRFCYCGFNYKINGFAFGLFEFDYEYKLGFQFATIYLVNKEDFKNLYYDHFKKDED